MQKDYTGKKVIVRAYGAGVFYGTLVEKEGRTVVLTDARRIFSWSGASDCTELAVAGCNKDSRLTRPGEVMVEEVLETRPCTEEAIKALDAVPVWSYR